MSSSNLYRLLGPSTVVFLDIEGENWETWLAHIRTDAIIGNVWRHIDPAVPDQQIPPLTPPPPISNQSFNILREEAEDGHINNNNNNNQNRLASEWAIARSLANNRKREWRLYDDKLHVLRVIRAIILWSAPLHWFTYQGIIGGGPFASVRNLLVFLSTRVKTIRSQAAAQERQQQQMFPGGGGGGDGGDGGGIAAVMPQVYVYPSVSESSWG